MNKIIVEIKWDWPEDPYWLNADNVALALHAYCKNTKFKVCQLANLFQGLLRFKQDEDGTWIVDDYRTVVYGDGNSPEDAFKDYIISLIDFSELLAASETELQHVREFVHRVNARAEMNMEKTGKLEGSHYAAMQVEFKKLEDELIARLKASGTLVCGQDDS